MSSRAQARTEKSCGINLPTPTVSMLVRCFPPKTHLFRTRNNLKGGRYSAAHAGLGAGEPAAFLASMNLSVECARLRKRRSSSFSSLSHPIVRRTHSAYSTPATPWHDARMGACVAASRHCGARGRPPHSNSRWRNDRAEARLPMTNSPQQSPPERPGEAALAVARALALLHARQDHAAALARELEAKQNDTRSHLRPLLVRSSERSIR